MLALHKLPWITTKRTLTCYITDRINPISFSDILFCFILQVHVFFIVLSPQFNIQLFSVPSAQQEERSQGKCTKRGPNKYFKRKLSQRANFKTKSILTRMAFLQGERKTNRKLIWFQPHYVILQFGPVKLLFAMITTREQPYPCYCLWQFIFSEVLFLYTL